MIYRDSRRKRLLPLMLVMSTLINPLGERNIWMNPQSDDWFRPADSTLTQEHGKRIFVSQRLQLRLFLIKSNMRHSNAKSRSCEEEFRNDTLLPCLYVWVPNDCKPLWSTYQKPFFVIPSKMCLVPLLKVCREDHFPFQRVTSWKLFLKLKEKWSTHVEAVCAKESKRLFALRSLKRGGVSPRDLRSVYSYFIRPVFEYAFPVWHTSLPRKLSDQLEQIQRRALRIIVPHLSYTNGLNELDLTTLEERKESICKSFYKNNLNTASKLWSLLPDPVDHYCNLRNPRKLPLYKCRNNRFSNTFLPYCVRKWDANP